MVLNCVANLSGSTSEINLSSHGSSHVRVPCLQVPPAQRKLYHLVAAARVALGRESAVACGGTARPEEGRSQPWVAHPCLGTVVLRVLYAGVAPRHFQREATKFKGSPLVSLTDRRHAAGVSIFLQACFCNASVIRLRFRGMFVFARTASPERLPRG